MFVIDPFGQPATGNAYSVENVAALRTFTFKPPHGTLFTTLGRVVEGDGLGSMWRWVDGATGTDDGINAVSTTAGWAGRFILFSDTGGGSAGAGDPVGTAAALVAIHEALSDPHPGYLTPAEGAAAYDALGAAAAAVAVHAGLADPHPGYLTAAEGNASYDAISAASTGDAAHVAALDPHPQYLTAAEGNAAYDAIGAAAAATAAHVAAGDPHPQYLTPAEGAAAYDAIGAASTGDAAHVAAGDPHPQYTTAAEMSAFAVPLTDPRLTDSRTPTAHAASHMGGSDSLGLGSMATQAASSVAITGGTITGMPNPSAASDVANKSYVDASAQGISYKSVARVATVSAGTLATSFENGDTIDGVVLVTGDRILIKDQTAPAENGIYTVNASGAPTRTADADSSGDLVGASVQSLLGTVNAGSVWAQTTPAPITVNTTALVFVNFLVVGGGLLADNNLSDVSNAASARSNLGLNTTYAPLVHAARHQSGGADSIALDTLAAPTDNTTLDATTSAHGLMRKYPGGTSTFLRADGAFAAPPGGSGGGAFTDFTKDVGKGTSGWFDITGLSGLTIGKNALVIQTAQPITSKGDARDEFEMDSIALTGYVAATDRIRVFWQSRGIVTGTYAFAYQVGA